MFLKSIEIRGFKSFADKTELNFMNGVTAVVGPNGSGKSNITDAVRWVLGEQSIKSLRGGKMEDVIFAGTQFRKPVGLAQVSLTLDNTDGKLLIDYIDVKISRRLYRSGESEYYINNTQCRLKDIQELFMDTGIGKEGYSIIGQGKIDAILSGKPEERRNLLEEAAGIVKFKSRKDEAEKKLNNTEQNLVRINDILATYEDRLEPLRIENEKAKEFIKLSEDLKLKEVNVVLDLIVKTQDRINSSRRDLEVARLDMESIDKEKSLYKEKNKSWYEKLEFFETTVGSQKQEYYENKNLYQKTISENTIFVERIETFNNLINKSKGELSATEAKLNDLFELSHKNEITLSGYKDDALAINKDIEVVEDEIQELSDLLSKSSFEINKYKDDKIELLNFISSSKNHIAILNNDMEVIEGKIDQLETAFESYNNSIKINTATKIMLEKDILKFQDKIKNYENEIRMSKNEIAKLNITIGENQKILKDANTEHNKVEANRNMLINLEKHYEGYNKSVKILMQHIDEGKILGAKDNCFVLGEVIAVEKELEVAIEVSLGGAISDIITSEEVLAKNLITYLKTYNLGRATFLPLTIIKGKRIIVDNNIKNILGYMGIASELVQFNNKYVSAIDYVLGRTIIAKDMDSALKIAKVANYSFKIVTISGEVVNPGGSLTGGSLYQKAVSIVGRKREIEELLVKLEEISSILELKMEEVSSDNKKLSILDDRCLNLRDEIHYETIEITKTQGKLVAIDSDTTKLHHNMKISREEMEDLKLNLEKNEEELKLKSESIDNLVEKDKLNSEKIEALELSLSGKAIEISDKKEGLTGLKIKKAQLDEILSNRTIEVTRVHNEISEYKSKIESIKIEIRSDERIKEDCINQLEKNEIKSKELLKNIDETEKSFRANEEEIASIKENIKKTSAELEESMLHSQKKEEVVHRSELSIAKFETELEAQYIKLNEEMEMTYAEASEFKIEVADISEFKKDIVNLKSSISSLGTINLGSIEEYEQIKETYTFMNLQREDLNRAINELLGVIEEMTSKMRNMFNANFKILRENFNETFRELFKGGSADLILSEGDELTANIEINVQPPGKKLQNINLMSGGEKVLSAIALLFAILKMKPTPFCILDEIEAALDDANVFRYAEFLKKFSATTQFIVITHRKGTMEASDTLYGVTMEEKGISKIVSVNLTN